MDSRVNQLSQQVETLTAAHRAEVEKMNQRLLEERNKAQKLAAEVSSALCREVTMTGKAHMYSPFHWSNTRGQQHASFTIFCAIIPTSYINTIIEPSRERRHALLTARYDVPGNVILSL